DALDRILVNLIGNAAKYSDPPAEIRISAEPADGRVRVAVHDQGPGLDPPHHAQVFERVFRVPGQTAARRGPGVGVAIVRQYVESIKQKDHSAFAALFSADAVLHDPFFPEPTKGRDALQSMCEGILRAFPDMAWKQVGDPIDAAGRVAFVVSVEGTNDGPLAMPAGDVPATGKAIAYEAAVFWKIDSDGLIAEERSYFDATGVAVQLGLTG
ncbi:MAG: nuclear transport factor 2 family protein, partial [Actinobacteria bacterium]|nr:nuclear transport factor 2 family protein [Actinomycetota bacterium]